MDINEDLKNRIKFKIAMLEIDKEKKPKSINKKVIAVACAILILSTGGVFAKDIEKYFKGLFNNSTEAIDTAVENGYVQKEEMDFVYDKDIGVKVDNLVVDDLNLAISFNFESKKEDIKSIRFNDFIITNDNDKVVYRSEFKSAETLDELPIYNSVSWGNSSIKLTDTIFLDSIVFGLRPEKEEFKELLFNIKSITLTYQDDRREIIDGNWNFNVIINDEMRKSTTVTYNMAESNEYIESCTATMTNTGTIVELNSKVEIPNITYDEYGVFMLDLVHLNINNKTYSTCGLEHSKNYMKIDFEDLGNFVENSNELELYLDFFNTTVVLVKENI